MSPTRSGEVGSAAWRAFADRDWRAIESETRRARILAYRRAGPEAHHAIYLELSEALLERREREMRGARSPSEHQDDQGTHERVQKALRSLSRR